MRYKTIVTDYNQKAKKLAAVIGEEIPCQTKDAGKAGEAE